MARRKDPINVRIEELTAQLEVLREEAMRRAGYKTFDEKKLSSFHGRIGGKNNVYVDAIRQVFLSPEQFISEWQAGALDHAKKQDAKDAKYGHNSQDSAAHKIVRYLQDPVIRKYMELFHERNFYKQHKERIRAKPEDALWETWIGSKNQEYGLFITPRYRDGAWENDVSEIRRADYEYWTIGHVLATGFIVAGTDKIYPINTIDDLLAFYQHVLVRAQGSPYGNAFAAEYVTYVKNHPNPERVPFPIPEIRYEGTEVGKHKHRLDFTILTANGHKVGIELSPWSTHGKIEDIRAKLKKRGGKTIVENERIEKWEDEAKKRNEYFQKFGITTLTFTDSELANIPEAFKKALPYLDPKNNAPVSRPDVQKAISAYKFQHEDEEDKE